MWLAGLGVWNAPGAGVTLITHGLNGTTTGWVTGMANALTSRHGENISLYRMDVSSGGGGLVTTVTNISGVNPAASAHGELIVILNWSTVAGGNSFNTIQVAAAVAPAFTSTNFVAELGGHALAEWPLHFIGHSRGGSLVCE